MIKLLTSFYEQSYLINFVGDEVAKFAEKQMVNELLSLESYKSGDYKTALKQVNLNLDVKME